MDEKAVAMHIVEYSLSARSCAFGCLRRIGTSTAFVLGCIVFSRTVVIRAEDGPVNVSMVAF